MEKLIELLNEYRYKELWFNVPEWEEGELSLPDYCIISKEYGFIKRLVDNDKIGLNKKKNKEFKRIDFDLAEWMDWYEITTEDVLLMWLSIQDEPIRFLCEIIK